MACRKRRMEKRLPAARDGLFVRRMSGAPAVLNTAGWKYERADRAQAIVYGGVPLMLRVARASGLIDAMASTVPILQGRCPYFESDHAQKNLIQRAEDLDESVWQALTRPARYSVQTKPRARPNNVKRQVVRRRQYEHLEL